MAANRGTRFHELAAAPPIKVEAKIGRPRGRRSDPDWQPVTLYLHKETYHTVADHLRRKDRKGPTISVLVTELLQMWASENLKT
jgi:hypothetical protein